MTSRFSTLQNRDAAPLKPAERPRAGNHGVSIPNARNGRGAEAGNASAQKTNKVLDARARIHRMLIEEINLVALERLPKDEMRRQVHEFVSEKTRQERMAINVAELDALVDDIVDEMVGLGPLEPLLKDPEINDILINGHNNCFVERQGKLQQVHIPFKDEAHLLRIINKIVGAVGRRVDESQPMVDARMLDGSRFNAAIRPVGVDGPLVSIRKFSKNKLGLHKLVEFGAITQNMAEVLAAAVHARKTTIISGGTGTGKTTMLNALSAFIPEDERLITIEDAAELQLQQPHVARMETRPANIEGHGELKQRDLVKNALRMRPDRVILGECRGEEAFDMLQAMNTGHEGSMATIHANTPRDAISRLEQMLGMTGMPMTVQSIRSQIASAHRHHRAADAPFRRQAQGDQRRRGDRHGRRRHPDAGDLQVRAHRHGGRRQDPRPFRGDRHPPALPRGYAGDGHRVPRQIFRTRKAAGIDGDVAAIYVIYAGSGADRDHDRGGVLPALCGQQRPPRRDQPAHEAAGKQDQPGTGADPTAQGARPGGRHVVVLAGPFSHAAHAVRADHADAEIPDDHVRRGARHGVGRACGYGLPLLFGLAIFLVPLRHHAGARC